MLSWEASVKIFQLTNDVPIADFEEVLDYRETRGVLRTPANI